MLSRLKQLRDIPTVHQSLGRMLESRSLFVREPLNSSLWL